MRWKPTLSNLFGIGGAAVAACLLAIAALLSAADAKKTEAVPDAKAALAEFNSLIGEWRGVGQVRRGSTDGAWSEKAEWVWEFDKGNVAVNWDVDSGKQILSGAVTWVPDRKVIKLTTTLPDKSKREYEGKQADGKFVFDSKPDGKGDVHRITITRLNDKRTLVLFEKRRNDATNYNRVAEVGYTREGTKLAAEGGGDKECVVTGGKGTMTVSYKGQTYYVCCSGCKQAFDDNPEGIIAEYKARIAKRSMK
jgi:YHS domain-containing protein